ncbi:transcription factor TFIIIB component B'' homolog [Phodopus roborovskii]|uniref:transcription factor TFIIIB component B'' homolog n=1 Tax=Phodopus roborovskii TaxID=109678 RepID=UPI0021E4540B|nr:transcription factor TFIIIB component B'' homolog [Phodopus roborovskii]
MFRRARLSVKPNVRPGGGARGSAAPNPPRGPEAPRPPEPATEPAPKPAEPTDVAAVDSGAAEPQEEAPGSSDAKTGDENNEEPSRSSSSGSQRRTRLSSTCSLVNPAVSGPPQCHPLSTANHDAPQPNLTPAKERQPCSDRYRIYKARKLREMLKEELRKEKKQWKNKFATNESQRPPDRSKMTMRDFIYYLPDNNPMTSSVEQEKKTEKSLAAPLTREQDDQSTPDAGDNGDVEEEADDGPLLVPRVKVAEDGSIILDEESLTVEVLRTKGPCVVEENDPIFERGSTTTYSSFRKNYYSKPWSNKETDMFFLAISMVGTDFSMIGQLFPHRARIEIKNKFKREEKTNGWRIDKAFQEKRPFDFDFFAHLLQKVLAEEEKRKQKSTKCQSSKEKASKPRKNVKAKKVASEEVNDDPDESVNSNISDPERSQKGAQTFAEEEPPTSSGQDLEQAMLEQDQNQERRRSQDEADKQETTNPVGNVHVELSPPEAETRKNTCPSDESEGESSKEQIPSFPQNTDDIEGLASNEKMEMRTDSAPSTCNEQNIMPLASESSESSGADLPVSEVVSAASCEVNNVGRICTEERNVDLKNKPSETEQAETVKPKSRSRLQRPKPNLSRAAGKKPVVSQDKQGETNKNSPPETSSEKNPMEKERMDVSQSLGTENAEREALGTEAVPALSGKSCISEDGQPKVLRPTRLMRGRMQRPRPNIRKAAERKDIPILREEIGAHVEKNEDESGADREKNESRVVIPQQVENESLKNLQCEDVISQPEKKGSFENVQSDEPKFLDECPSIQEGNKANKLKQAPVLRTRFQKPKPKPNVGRRRIASREGVPEEIPVSGEITAALEETTRPDTSPWEKIPNVTIGGLTVTPSTKELESDSKDTRRNDISSNMKMSEMTDVTMEMEIGLETIGRDISSGEMGAEMIDIPMETETGLNEISPMEKVPELIDTTEEIYTNLEETGRREIFPQGNGPKEVTPISETETGLPETGKELPTGDKTADMIDGTEKGEAHSEETERQEIPAPVKEAEGARTMGEVETHLKESGGESPHRGHTEAAPAELLLTEMDMCSGACREEAGMEPSAVEDKEPDLKPPGHRHISVMAPEAGAGEMPSSEGETSQGLKQTGESSVSWERGSGEIVVGEEMVADLEKAERVDVSPRGREPEGHTSKPPTADVIQSSSGNRGPRPSLDRKNISNKTSVIPTFVEEKENADKEVSSHLSHVESSLQNSGHHEIDPGIRLPDVLGQFSDTNLSKSLPQEQKPLEVKPAPFLRSRFKKPKPNLSRAAIKRTTPEAEPCVPGKRPEADKMVTTMLQQDIGQADSPSSQHVPSLMTSRENDNSGPQEEAVILPCIQTETDSLPPNLCEPREDSQLTQNQEAVILPCIQTETDSLLPKLCEPREDSQLTQNQENGLVVPIGTPKMNVVTQEAKQSVQITLPVRGRLQRPRPNVQKARQRQVVDRGEAEDMAKSDGSELSRAEAKTSLGLVNSHIESEVKVVSCGISEYRVNESHSHVVPEENLNINKTSILDEQISHEGNSHVPSPAQLLRRRLQRAKPNIGGAHHKKEHPCVEKDTTEQSTAPEPGDRVLPKGDVDIQLSLKVREKTEILTSLEVSERKDCIDPEESGSDRNDAQLKAAPAGAAREAAVEDHPTSSLGLEEQGLSKQISRPQLLKESYYSKSAPHRRTTLSSASECEIDHSGKRAHRKMKPNVTKGRGSKRIRGKTAKKEPRASKSMLVTLRASQKEDEDDAEDFDSDYEEEPCHLAPEELNKAPVFVPVGLRSPEPVSAQIEETMEELEITMDVADIGCVTVVEHQLSNMDATTQDVQPEKDLHSSFEMVVSEQTQEEPGPSDGSTEAAITLLTMGDIVLQSEIITDQGDVGVCVFPDVHSKDKSHVPFSPDIVNHKIVPEYQEVSSPVISASPASFEENKTVLKEPSPREEADVMGEVMESRVPPRNTASTVTKHLRMENPFILTEPNSEQILGICGLDGHQEVASVCVTKGTEGEIQRETEENVSKAEELEDKSLEPGETKELHQLSCVHGAEGTIVSQETILRARSEGQEANLQEVQMPGAAVASSEIGPHTLDSGQGLGESPAEEPLRENSKDSSMLMLQVPEIVPSNIPEVQQENMISPQDVTVNLFTNLQQDGEDEQAFILTLVEIPTDATEGFTDASMQLMPSSLLPAPILVKSGNTVERGDLSGSLQATSVVQDALCLSSGSSDSEKLPAKVDPMSRKRFHCSPDENILVPPAKKSSVTPGIDCQECASEVCPKELNVFEKTEESCMGQCILPISESTHTTPKPQKEHNEPTFQNAGTRSPNEIKDPCVEKTMTQLPQDEMVSDKEEKTDPVSSSEQKDSMMSSSSKPPLIRPGRRPLGFLSLICPKNSLDSDEVTQTHSKKRLKPHIPISRRNLKKSNLVNANQKKNESSDPLPSPSVVTDTQSDNTGSSATQVSSDQPPIKEKCKNGPKRASEEEATTVSEFVLDDIFIEVDETE